LLADPSQLRGAGAYDASPNRNDIDLKEESDAVSYFQNVDWRGNSFAFSNLRGLQQESPVASRTFRS